MFVVAVAGVVLLVACGDLPRPYKTRSLDEKIGNPILSLRDNHAVYVAPIRGTTGENGAYLAALIAEKLHGWDILATTRGQMTDGYGLVAAGRHTAGQLHIEWSLRDEAGTPVEEGFFSLPSSDTAWTLGRPDLMRQIADRVAEDISKALKPTRLEAVAKADAVAGARVAMGQMTGAPGDGNQALLRSLKLLLKNAKIPMTETSDDAAMIVGGEVRVMPVDGAQEQVVLTWIMQRPDGTELARIQQQNVVPRGALDQRWGDAAYYAATAVVDSVVEVHSIVAAAYADSGTDGQ